MRVTLLSTQHGRRSQSRTHATLTSCSRRPSSPYHFTFTPQNYSLRCPAQSKDPQDTTYSRHIFEFRPIQTNGEQLSARRPSALILTVYSSLQLKGALLRNQKMHILFIVTLLGVILEFHAPSRKISVKFQSDNIILRKGFEVTPKHLSPFHWNTGGYV